MLAAARIQRTEGVIRMKVTVRRVLASTVVLAASAAGAGAASAKGPTPVVPHSCPLWTAQVSHGRVGQVAYDPVTGREVGANAIDNGRLVFRKPYKALGDATVEYQGNTYAVRAGAEFALSCYGQSISRPNDLNGALYLHSGRMAVDTTSSRPGGIKTFEALMNPVGATAQHIDVSRKTRNGVTGRVRMSAGGPIVDVTPELGDGAGHCIYHHQVRLVSSFNAHAQNFELNVTVVR
jgi:hypothetical protein